MLLSPDRYLWEENVYDISVDYNVIDKSDTLGIHKHLMIKNNQIIFVSNQTKCVSLSNQKCITQPTLINLHPNESS